MDATTDHSNTVHFSLLRCRIVVQHFISTLCSLILAMNSA